MIIEIVGVRYTVWQCKTCGVQATCPEVVYDERRAEGGFAAGFLTKESDGYKTVPGMKVNVVQR